MKSSFGGHFDQYALRQYFHLRAGLGGLRWEHPLRRVTRHHSDGNALYVQDPEWSFLPNWKLIAGGRRGVLRSTFDGAGLNYEVPFPTAAPFPYGFASAWQTVSQGNNYYQSRSVTAFSPKASLSYQATETT